MLLSYEQFKSCAHHFEKVSKDLTDNWIIYKCSNDENIVYLKKTVFKSSSIDDLGLRTVFWEYHIVYSFSYFVPVLYFNACFENGKLLSVEQLEKFIDPIFKEQFSQNKWNILSQQEHPYLRTPFFMLHPCNTEDFMKPIFGNSQTINPLITWLSTIAALVNLNVNPGYDYKMKVLELYSGIGGMHYALKASDIRDQSEVVCAIELNPVCNNVYEYNFPQTMLLNKSIISLTATDINILSPNMLLLSPPCQPFTRLGKQKDVNDERNSSLLKLINLLPELNTVSYLLLENVKGFEVSETRQRLLTVLKNSGFTSEEYLLNSRQFGICNSRLRYYLLAKKTVKPVTTFSNQIICELPQEYTTTVFQKFRTKIPTKISQILEHKPLSNEWTSYLLSEKYLKKYFSVMDIVTWESENSCCFTRGYTRYIEGTGSVLSEISYDEIECNEMFLKKLHSNTVEVADYNLNLELLKKLKLRYFTPKEIARLMLFPDSFSFPEYITLKQRYKMLSNSVNVFVVAFLISHLTKNCEL